ncbi:MAG: FtsH protease activity modulator HflK [Acidobacteria bacterium]|nr:FtsH protease activity modulator HflK [Acidobacteriota bacterium]
MSNYDGFPGFEGIKLPQIKSSWAWIALIALGIIIILFESVYTVGSQESGVVQRFGKYTKMVTPGLHFKAPFIDKVTKVPVYSNLQEEFGFRTREAGVQTVIDKTGFEDESLMLTGDLNIVKVNWIIQFKIKDPIKYIFRVRAVQETVRDLSESVIRMEVGNHSVDEVLTIGREEIASNSFELLQKRLDEYETGVDLLLIKLQDVVPPDAVAESFNEVEKAKQEKERMINQAEKEYNKVIPEAEGEAKEMISKAEGVAISRVNKALGDVAKFKYVYAQYKRAPQVTRTRLFLETMTEILPKAGKKLFVDPSQKGVLNLMNLTDSIIQKSSTQKEGN